jgi:hypothetical protein
MTQPTPIRAVTVEEAKGLFRKNVSHSVVLMHVPNKGDTTVTSLLVRVPKAE